MNAFDTQVIRKKHGVDWNEEYIIAMVHHSEDMNTSRVLNIARIQKVMSTATAHKYLMSAIKKKFLLKKQDKEDRRGVHIVVSASGERFLEEIKNAYVRK